MSILANWFIPAAGKAKRCGGDIKQLFTIDGTPIITRTVRLINKVDKNAKIYIITWRDEILNEPTLKKYDNVHFINTVIPTENITETIMLTKKYWGDENIVVYSDTIFTLPIISDIFDYCGPAGTFGKVKCPITGIPESYALKFFGHNNDAIFNGYYQCDIKNHEYSGKLACCFLYDRHILWHLARLHTRGGLIGWIYWKIITFYIARHLPHVEIDDKYVFDVDSREEFDRYKELMR